MSDPQPGVDPKDKPVGNVGGLFKYARYDIISGFLVFLIALPLCLGISLACGYPAIAGIFTAIIGAILTTTISNSELTIKGPAAGLIVIAVGCVKSLGSDGQAPFSDVDLAAYHMALAVGVVAAVLQIVFGLFRAGILAEFFPLSAVHGMLAAIGVIIIVKQVPVALGFLGAGGEPLEMIREIPEYIHGMNPVIALIGGIGVAIMFLWPQVRKLHKLLKAVPAPLVVLLVTVPMAMYLHLNEDHTYVYHGDTFSVGSKYLVDMPDHMFGMFEELAYPDFTAFTSEKYRAAAIYWAFMFFIIGSLESLLSAKAIDLLDPWRRKTNLDRDMVAVGAGNLAASLVGGLPMISEIVRSKANIDNGARTRFADMWHGVFLLACVALIPTILHLIPLAALASMLIYTGFRLAHPTEFLHMLKIGKEQLVIFSATLVGVLATDLLKGIGIGIAVKLAIHLLNGVPLRSVFKPYLDVENKDDNTVVVTSRTSAIFSNWIIFRRQLLKLGLEEKKRLILDLSETKLVDHSVMEKLHELQRDFEQAECKLEIIGLENHKAFSNHPLASRKKAAATAETARP